MEQKIIIHLSDLHVSNHNDDDGIPLTKINSWLTTNPDDTQNKNYIDEFVNYINNNFKDEEKYLIISGDLADKSLKDEYCFLEVVLERILSALQIDKNKILIVPGDHDVNRINLSYAYQNSDKTKPAYEFSKEKFLLFSNFYKKFFSKDFEYEKVISDTLVFDKEKLLIIGMNSNGKIGTKGGDGYINNDKLGDELKQLLANYTNYSKIAVFHHNLSGQYENNLDGQWDANNKIEILRTIENYKFEVVMFGNEHTSASNSINQLVQISVGSFAKKDCLNSFKIYKINCDDKSLSLDHYRYTIINDKAHTTFPFGTWSKTELNGQNENIPEIVLRKPVPKEEIIETKDLTGDSNIALGNEIILSKEKGDEQLQEIDEVISAKLKTQSPQLNFNDNDYHKKIFKIVKDLDLFKSGHFHWSDYSKAHNWIDIPMLLSERDNVLLAQKAILDIVIKNHLEFDFVLGLGIEGNIIANYTALRLNKPYSYLPYSYRYKDHEEYEKNISVKNGGRYKKILIITDVVDNGKTVDHLLERETDFFSDEYVKKISVVSLFFTGEANSPLIDINPLAKIQHYFVSHMKVERCPYGEDFRETCMIYREKLACVHEFYDSSKSAESILIPR